MTRMDMMMATKDLMDVGEKQRRDSQVSCSSTESDILTPEQLQPVRERRDSLIHQFRDFLRKSVDFSFKIDDPFEKEMY